MKFLEDSIDYTNFKNAAHNDDKNWNEALLDVWFVMNNYQNR
jgi:hypothetical protein